jgi:outer membrane protein assembly factor BamB
VVAQDKVYFGASDGRVYALKADTGVEAWEPFPTGGKIWSTPVVADGTLYVTSFDKKLYALDVATGEPKWATAEAGGAIASTPLVYDNTVYFGAFDRYLYAVAAADGSLKWKSEVEAGNWFWATPVAYGNTVYAPCLDGKVYVFDAEDGHEIDAIDFGEPISSSPVLVDGAIIIASEEGRIYSLKDNQKRELKNLGATVHAPLCARDGVVYVHTQEDEALYALEAETGTEKWPARTLMKPEAGE